MEPNYDVFLSYAGEDREAVALPLVAALRSRDLRVWFDRESTQVGAGVGSSIDAGMAASRHVVEVFSKAYLRKNWPARER